MCTVCRPTVYPVLDCISPQTVRLTDWLLAASFVKCTYKSCCHGEGIKSKLAFNTRAVNMTNCMK